MLKQTLVLGLLTLSGLYSAHAQEVLTLEKALNTAFEHSPSLIQSKLSLEQRQLNLKAQDASLKSQFSLDVTPFRYTRNNQYDNFNSKWYANETKMSSASFGITQPIKWTDGTISLYNDFSWQDASNRTSGGNNTSFNHNLSLRISQPLFTYNRTKMQLKELEYALENAKISYALQQLSIEKNVTSQFYDVYQKQKDLNISRDEYNNQKQNYDTPAVKVKANQSAQKDFEGSDLIVADGQTVTYGSPTLRFTHRTARVTIVLTDYTEGLASVQLTDLSTENDNPAEITPYDKGSNTYTAIVAPQSVAAGTAFITCTFTNGKTFVYKMKNATDWQAGGEYTYTVSLAAAKDLGYTIESNGSYTVYNADGLLNVAELVNGGKTDINITLDKNIDLTGKGWTPIGTSFDNSYTGTFDGGGHTITGLAVTTNDQFVGLFGYLNRAGTVKNVVMEGIQITSNHMFGCTGGVVGYSWGTIENCSVSGSVSGTDCVGGVVGSQKAGSIIGCCTSATVKGTHYVGGVAGEKWGTMTACYATGNVTLEIASQKNLSGGGVVGLNGGSRVLACYATGNVTSTGSSTGNVHIGGLFGDSYTTVTACYWKNNQERGYNTAPESTKVDGTDVTWQKAVDAMNTALQNAGSKWRYELKGALPTLRKQ